MMSNVKYRKYDKSLNMSDVEALFDADEYFQDIVHSLSKIQNPTIFITSWLLVPSIRLSDALTFEDLLIQELKKDNSKIYLLWNTNYNGLPYPNLLNISRNLHSAVTKKANADPDQFKIILSTNLEYEPMKLGFFLGTVFGFEKKILNKAETKWLSSFPKDRGSYKNLTAFTLGSHHQKTFTIIGTDNNGVGLIRTYCGGIDFSPGPSGLGTGIYHGGAWWHDAVMRVKGANAFGVLSNFVERWNDDLKVVIDKKTLAYGVTNSDTLDFSTLKKEIKEMSAVDANKVDVKRTVPLAGIDFPGGRERIIEILSIYKEWIVKAKAHIVIINQYFRSLEIADLLRDHLNNESNVRLTIVLPAYSEEMGKRIDLSKLRAQYASRTMTSDMRANLLPVIRDKALTIDPINKLTVYIQSKCLKDLVAHPRVRVWIPKPTQNIPYIHAKMFLVDKAMLMIGSANLNGRSLLGSADSEINLLLTDGSEIERIQSGHKWNVEPEGEWMSNYQGTWYNEHNLVRYTREHWEVDSEYGAFPKGRKNLINYAERIKSDGRLDMMELKFTKDKLEADLDNLESIPGIDLSSDDLGKILIEASEHLL